MTTDLSILARVGWRITECKRRRGAAIVEYQTATTTETIRGRKGSTVEDLVALVCRRAALELAAQELAAKEAA